MTFVDRHASDAQLKVVSDLNFGKPPRSPLGAFEKRPGQKDIQMPRWIVALTVVLIAGCAAREGTYRQEIADAFLARAAPFVLAETIADNCEGVQPRLGALMMAPNDVVIALSKRYSQADLRATVDVANTNVVFTAYVDDYLSARGVDPQSGPALCAYGRSVAGQEAGVGAFLEKS